ncbi:hypothetical protein HOL46_04665 [Candidatus Falkowbacteria bacterium]|nr:hypothetical protein [Candidatus Falkowbacteria bacterium]
MKNKKLVALVAGAALLANLALFASASALSSSHEQEIGAGSVTLTSVPTSVNFTSVAATATINTVTKAFGDNTVRLIDLRDTDASFTIQVDPSNDGFVMNGNSAFSFAPDKILINGHTGAAADTVTGGTGSNCTGIGVTSTFNAFASNGDASNITNTVSGARVAECALDPALRILIPAYTEKGTYRTTLVWTLS